MEFMSLMATIGVELQQFKRDLNEAQKAAKTFKRRPEMSDMSLGVEAQLDTEEFDDKLDELTDDLKGIDEDVSIDGEADIDTGDYESGIDEIVSLATGADADVDGDASILTEDYANDVAEIEGLARDADADVNGDAVLIHDDFDSNLNDVESSAADADADVDGKASIDIKPFIFAIQTASELADDASSDASVEATATLDISKFESSVSLAEGRAEDLKGAIGDVDGAAGDADTSVGGVGKNADYSGVIERLEGVRTGLENIISTAAHAVKALAGVAIDSSNWADQLLTEATQYHFDTTTLQQMRYASLFIDTEVGAIEGATTRLTRNLQDISEGSGTAAESWEALAEASGHDLSVMDSAGNMRPALDIFFDIVDALGDVENETERDNLAMGLLGRNIAELNPLIDAGSEAYRDKMAEAPVLAEDSVDALGNLNDAYQDFNANLEETKLEVLAALAPSITEAVTALTEFIKKFREFLETDEGQEALEKLNSAISNIVSALTDEKNIETIFTALSGAVEKLTTGLQWVVDNPEAITNAFTGIAGAIGGIKVGEGVLTLLTFLQNGMLLKSLAGLGAGKGLAAAGAGGAGAAGGAGGGALIGGSLWTGLGNVATVAAPVALAAGYTYGFYKLLESDANKTENTQVYGDWDSSSASDTAIGNMTPEIAEAVRSYWEVYQDEGSEAAMDARQALEDAFAEGGFIRADNATQLVEDTFDEALSGVDNTGLVSELARQIPGIFDGIDINGLLGTDVEDGITEGGETGSDALLLAIENVGLAEAITQEIEDGFENVNIPSFNVPITLNTGGGADKHASGMDSGEILHGLTPFGYDANGVVHYGGEAGPEAVVGVNSLNEMIQRSVNAAMANVQTVRQPINVQLILDSGELLAAMDVGLNDRANWRGGGRA